MLNPKDVQYIIIHSSHTQASPKIGFSEISRLCRARAMFSCGYHFIIRTDGCIEPGRSLTEPGNHCLGFNDKSLGVCLVGGKDRKGHPADTRTWQQRKALAALLDELRNDFPGAIPVTHSQLHPRTSPNCPGWEFFDDKETYKNGVSMVPTQQL